MEKGGRGLFYLYKFTKKNVVKNIENAVEK